MMVADNQANRLREINQAKRNQQVRWRSRRGMLELDLLLAGYAKDIYPNLPEPQKQGFEALLACEDNDLDAWLSKGQQPVNDQLATAVSAVLAYVHSH
jgi:antitoxin CptB